MSLNSNQAAVAAAQNLDQPTLATFEDRRQVLQHIASGTTEREKGIRDTGEAVDYLRRAGVGKLRVPIEEGGYGLSLRELIEFAIGLGEADPSVAQILRNHFAFVEQLLKTRGNVQYEKSLDDVKAGKLIGLGATETGVAQAGTMKSDSTLVRVGDEYRLNGRKFYSTGNMYSDLIRVFAMLDGQLVSAMVPVNRPGVSFDDDWDGFGQSRTASGTTILNDVVVYESEIFPQEEKVRLPYSATFPQLYLNAVVAGILRNIEKDAVSVIQRRGRNFYHAVAEKPVEDPLLQEGVGRISSVVYIAESAVLRSADALGAAYDSVFARQLDVAAFEDACNFVAKTKVVVDDLALEAASALFNIAGASATSRSAQLDRHWRNIRTLASHNPVSYKARALGDNLINGTPLPTAGFF